MKTFLPLCLALALGSSAAPASGRLVRVRTRPRVVRDYPQQQQRQPEPVEVVEVRAAPVEYGPATRAQASYSSARVAQPSYVPETRAAPVAEPIAIVRSVNNAPGTPGFENAFEYSYEAENGIQQEATGEMKYVGDTAVMVMRGSYSYIGADGEDYVVNWYADETGYHAEAEHLPKPVEIPFEEQRIAVEEQLRFAAEQRASEARSASSGYGASEARAASTGYGASEARAAPSSYGASEARAAPTGYGASEARAAPSSYGASEARAAPTNYGAAPAAPEIVEVVEVRQEALPQYQRYSFI